MKGFLLTSVEHETWVQSGTLEKPIAVRVPAIRGIDDVRFGLVHLDAVSTLALWPAWNSFTRGWFQAASS